jgi:predicted amidohydrolase
LLFTLSLLPVRQCQLDFFPKILLIFIRFAMENFTFALAQSASVPGDVRTNVAEHVRWIEAAAAQGVQLLVFPELSLSGYEPALAQQAAIEEDDPALRPLRVASLMTGVTVIAGAPLRDTAGGKPFIAALIFQPDGEVIVQCKQHLHPGEDAAFQAAQHPGQLGRTLEMQGQRIALAICADFSHASHAAAAAQAGATLYIASALVSEGGYAADAAMLEGYARSHPMAVALANHGADTGGWKSAGKSALWGQGANLLVQAPAGEAMMIATCDAGSWSARVLTPESVG